MAGLGVAVVSSVLVTTLLPGVVDAAPHCDCHLDSYPHTDSCPHTDQWFVGDYGAFGHMDTCDHSDNCSTHSDGYKDC